MPTPLTAILLTGSLAFAAPPREHAQVGAVVELAQQNRIGRSYVKPRTTPGAQTGPVLSTPGYLPRSAPRRSGPSGRPSTGALPPSADACARGYTARSQWTRREFNQLCGQGS